MVGLAKTLHKSNLPYIVIPHGSLTKKAQATKRLKKIAGNFVFFNRFAKKANAIQFLSQNEANNSVSKNKHTYVSTNGMYMPSEQKTGFNEDKTTFSYIGRYDLFHKGLDLLVDAIKKKEDFLRKNNCVFNLYGPHTPGILRNLKNLKILIHEINIADLITINEGLFDNEKTLALLNTDIFIQTSRFEGMPMGILEAMSYGVPCLVTRGTYLKDFVDKYDAGWSCETTADAIADTIEKAVLERQLLNEKSKNATVLIEKEFLWDNVAKDALENYRKFI
jgi:glycosyltransferase involved in cell wall biosynthesis